MKYYNKFSFKKTNKKNIFLASTIIIILLLFIITVCFYIFNINFRNFLDIHLFRKSISSSNATIITFYDILYV